MQQPRAQAIGAQEHGVAPSTSDGMNAPCALPVGADAKRAATRWLLCVVSFVEGADAQLLPATFHALEADLGLSPVGLGSMSLAQSLFQAVAAPLWGFLADRGQRKSLLVASCVAWAGCTLLLSCITSVRMMFLLRCVHGATLASLNPVGQSVVADVVDLDERGATFGRLHFFQHSGQVLASLIGVSVANKTVSDGILAGARGWRLLFAGMAVLAFGAALLLYLFFSEPLRESNGQDVRTSFNAGLRATCTSEIRRLGGYFAVRTFVIIAAQGVFGCVPWNALGFLPLYLVYCGHHDAGAAVIASALLVGAAFGGLLGGALGDLMGRRSPAHGRPCTAQLSVFSGLPLTAALLMLAPVSSSGVLALLTLTIGLMASWCGVGVNRPILTEIVEPSGRASIIAWLTSFEGSSAALFGAPVVGWLSESVFGYRRAGAGSPAVEDATSRSANADALRSALLCATLVPWTMCLFFFSLLHWTYPKDQELGLTFSEFAGTDQLEMTTVVDNSRQARVFKSRKNYELAGHSANNIVESDAAPNLGAFSVRNDAI